MPHDDARPPAASVSAGDGAATARFFCGVVEGFYNRPWSQSQRLDLFAKMSSFGLNAYLYAPKDDHKHRAMWRQPYHAAERAELKTLIDACDRRKVRFFYGISPGLDMSYSSEKDLGDLKAKVDDLRRLGCSAFALLWDDIDTTLPVEDRHAFKTLAEAHVKVTNAVYEHLGRPDFFCCPVEYCANRTDPNVRESEYLNTLGSGLLPEIEIFWTGSRVVSEEISKEELVEVGEVFRRKPLIWDNLHANDYDHQSMFLGPFSGRDPDIIPQLHGILINPNCEYSFNVPALFTLAAWSHCYDRRSGQITPWNPLSAAELAVPHFLAETRRPTAISVHSQNLKESVFATDSERQAVELTKEDIELLFHLFWLPHSHGPQAESLLNEFKFLRDHAHLVQNYDYDAFDDSQESDESQVDTAEQEFVDSWMERASSFNNVCKRYSKICDKFTFAENRELFFDINSYMNDMQVMLKACDRWVKWVGLERCRRPIRGGPTLSGLPGGMVGELQRLFPIKSNCEYPLQQLQPALEKYSFNLHPLTPSEHGLLKDGFRRLFCDSRGMEESDLSESVHTFLRKSKLDAFLEQPDTKALCIDFDEVLASYVVGTRKVDAVCQRLEAIFKEDRPQDDCKMTLPVTLPASKQLDVPWRMLASKHDAMISFVSGADLLFTKVSANMLKLVQMLLSGGENDSRCKNVCVLVERSSTLTRQFLTQLDFKDVHRGERFGVMAKDNTSSTTENKNTEERMTS